MVHKLYENFLEDRDVYRACERYWENLTSRIAESLDQGGQWKQWMTRHWANGTPMPLDGNPIFDRWNNQLGRAFRILQHPKASDELEIAAWLNSEPSEPELPQYELVINIGLSEESALLAERLVRKWMTPETTPDDMQSFITEYVEPHYRRSFLA